MSASVQWVNVACTFATHTTMWSCREVYFVLKQNLQHIGLKNNSRSNTNICTRMYTGQNIYKKKGGGHVFCVLWIKVLLRWTDYSNYLLDLIFGTNPLRIFPLSDNAALELLTGVSQSVVVFNSPELWEVIIWMLALLWIIRIIYSIHSKTHLCPSSGFYFHSEPFSILPWYCT